MTFTRTADVENNIPLLVCGEGVLALILGFIKWATTKATT